MLGTLARSRKEQSGPCAAVSALEALAELGGDVRGWELYGLELGSAATVRSQAYPSAQKMMAQARALLSRIERTEGTVPSDIAFFAGRELNKLGTELEQAFAGDEGWRAIEVCERLRAQLMGAASALHAALCESTGVEAKDPNQAAELADALAIRRTYARFRSQIAKAGTSAASDIVRKMRLVGTAAAMVIGSAEYRRLSVDDRVLLRRAQQEILGWLTGAREDDRDAERIWGDLLGFVEVSRRARAPGFLGEHDQSALAKLSAACDACGSEPQLPRALLQTARLLWGAFPTLDTLIENHEQTSVIELGQCVAGLRQRQIEQCAPGADTQLAV